MTREVTVIAADKLSEPKMHSEYLIPGIIALEYGNDTTEWSKSVGIATEFMLDDYYDNPTPIDYNAILTMGRPSANSGSRLSDKIEDRLHDLMTEVVTAIDNAGLRSTMINKLSLGKHIVTDAELLRDNSLVIVIGDNNE